MWVLLCTFESVYVLVQSQRKVYANVYACCGHSSPFKTGLGCSLMFHSAGSTHINILSHMHAHTHTRAHTRTHTLTYLHRQVSHPFQLQLWPTFTGMSVFMYVWMPERERSGRPKKRKTTSWGAIWISIGCNAVGSLSSHVWVQFACRKSKMASLV